MEGFLVNLESCNHVSSRQYILDILPHRQALTISGKAFAYGVEGG